VRLWRPSRVSVRSTTLHSVRVAGRRPHRIIRRLVPSVRRRHTVAGRHESRRRHTIPREARQLLGCCPVLVPAERSATQRRQVGGGHPRHSTSALIGCHYTSGRGRWQQAAGCSQAEVARCNNRSATAVRLPCQRRSKGVQLPHTRPTSCPQFCCLTTWPRQWRAASWHPGSITATLCPPPPSTSCNGLRTTWPESPVSAEVEPTLNHFSGRSTGCQ